MARAITVEHLRKTYRDTVAVDDATFEVEQNEIFGIIGPNGSGKTTTVECLQGLRTATSGQMRVLGLDPKAQGTALRERIGSQLQESALPERIKVWEALDLFAAAASGRRQEWRDLATEWGIYDRRNAAFANLSGGQRQRLFIALALASNPQIVFLDEMTTGLDPAARRVAWSLIESVRERGATIVLVTHFMDEAEHLCDRIAVFKAGRIAAMDSPEALMLRHAQTRTVTFSSDEPDLSWLSEVPGVSGVERHGSQVVVLGAGPVLAYVGAALVARGMAPPDLRVNIPTLEDVYMSLVGEMAEA
jgi:ABC-2 type transport system ATP-binding protein